MSHGSRAKKDVDADAYSDIPIVLLHGLIGTLDDDGILAPFGKRAVHAPNLLGYGTHRAASPAEPTLQDQSDGVQLSDDT